MKNILIIGSNGFIGKNICHHLSEMSFIVLAADRASSSTHNHCNKYHQFDVTKSDFIPLLKDVDAVIYLVSTLLPQASNVNVELDINENLIPIIKLLEAIRISGRDIKVIFSSSGGTVYGIHEDLIEETAPLVPKCSYGIIKVTVEHYLKLYHDLYGIKSISLRISNPYGPGQNIRKPQGVVGIFLSKIIAGKEIEIWGDGSIVRDFIHVEDVAEAFRLALTADIGSEAINIGSGHGLSLNQLLSLIFELTQKKPKIIYQSPRQVDVPYNILDINKAYQLLGWSPKIEMREGLSKVIKENFMS
ncbi:NAD-dependent epimerase/dehydratase family protein [Pantoea dispersa]|uniref:NAD-dependent epimerase/dehydratase family protein n=1 Tax=Pantoea dispersa TaxID=59814 RepID=UPI002DBCA025|nr:NAD-dependent epimerase/dehydratase family protein [Pantoea dispersa]MEB5836183.1 NAD-dependent epimerase/dehydratase family protein [Pantoea dispersa]